MKKMNITAIELGVATSVTTITSVSAQLDPLWTALIGFGVSLVTMVGGELVKWLVAYFKKKTKDIEGNNDNEQDKGSSTTT